MKTKTKTKQSIILLSIVIIEFIGFNNQFKYMFLDWLHPSLEVFFILYMNWFRLASAVIVLSAVTYFWLKLRKQKNEPLFIIYLIKGFQVKGSDLLGIFNVVFTLCSISWIGIEIYNQTITGLINATIFAGFMILYPLLIANYVLPNLAKGEKYHPKILITALSMINEKNLRQSLDEMKEEHLKEKWLDQTFYNPDGSVKKAGQALWGPWGNLDPIRKSIIEHDAYFHEIILISSSEATEACLSLPDDSKPEKIISDFINRFFPHHRVKIRIISEGISGSDMVMNGVGIENILRSIFARGFHDKDILFNVTGATVAISGAMILKAIPFERRAEYARQDSGKIEEIPLSIFSVKELWNELLDKVG